VSPCRGRGIFLSVAGRIYAPPFSHPKELQQDLLTLKDLIEAGKLTPVIDRTYPLSEAPNAIRYLEQGHARGKVVLNVSE
jgi:NADPH:quinone reductase-like Zn-dependent oxidoreductase